MSKRKKFWEKVLVAGPTDCWLWIAGKNKDGYGNVWWNGGMTNAHRLAWASVNGPIPDGMFVLHRCDNRACCNPAHLFIGTNRENMLDCISKGRHNRGAGGGWIRRRELLAEVGVTGNGCSGGGQPSAP